MNEERIKELFANEDFVNDLFASESFEAAQKKLADKDVEMSIDELKNCVEYIRRKHSGEISDEELESISGGSIATFFAIVGFGALVSGTFVGMNAIEKKGC